MTRTEISVIIPTLRERDNLERLLPLIADVLRQANLAAEIVVVDDNSRDGTEDLCRQLAECYPVRHIIRREARGLATAVLHGLANSAGDICVVMDADSSHPPSALPELIGAVRSSDCDIAIGSRYVRGGSVDPDWSLFRRLNSRVATLLARGLTRAADPLAGFFAIRRATLARATTLQPLGYKVSLELIVRCKCQNIIEVPIAFRDRKLGESKLSAGQMWLYLRHLARLYASVYLPEQVNPRNDARRPSPQISTGRKAA